MNMQHVKYAVEVEKTGSISQAAASLFMGQPNLSKAIKELEESLGFRIFKRTQKGVIVTEKGREFLTSAKGILSDIEEMEARYTAASREIQVLSVSVPCSSYITSAFLAFLGELDDEKDIEVSFSECGSGDTLNKVMQQDNHLGIVRYHVDCEAYFLRLLSEQGLDYKELWEFESVALFSRKNPLAQQKEPLLSEELKPYIEITQNGCAVRPQAAEGQCRAVDAQGGHKRIYMDERRSQLEILHHTPNAYMWSPPMSTQALESHGLVQKSCGGSANLCKDILIFQRGYSFSKLENLFLEKLEQEKNKIIGVFRVE